MRLLFFFFFSSLKNLPQRLVKHTPKNLKKKEKTIKDAVKTARGNSFINQNAVNVN